jgi:uncharacterized protein (TIGR03067 family)
MSPLPYLTGTTLDVKGPDAGSVRFVRKAVEFELRAPRKEDFPLLQPGQKWERTINYPADEFCYGHFFLLKPGEYRIRATYRLLRETNSPLAKGSWTGTVTSNPIVLKVAGPANPFGKEVKGLRARVSFAPCEPRFPVGEAIPAKFAVKNVSQVEQTLWHSGFWPNHQIIVRNAKGKEPPLTRFGRQCRQAFSPGGERGKNAPWKLKPGGEDTTEGNYDLTRLYNLSRPGRYTVQYVYEEKHDGGWKGRLLSTKAAFAVVAKAKAVKKDRLAESKAVRVNGVDFQAVVQKQMATPAPGGALAVDLGLRITNRGKKPLLFNLFDTIRPTLKSPQGKAFKNSGVRKRTAYPAPILLPAGASKTFFWRGRLECPQGGGALRLVWADGTGMTFIFEGLGPGKYSLSFECENTRQALASFLKVRPVKLEKGQSFWIGKATTREVAFKIVQGAKQAKDAREDRSKLQGLWLATQLHGSGQNVLKGAKPFRVLVKGDTITFAEKIKTREFTFKLDAEPYDKRIDLVPAGGLGQAKTWLGIYRVQGDKLWLCFYKDGCRIKWWTGVEGGWAYEAEAVVDGVGKVRLVKAVVSFSES